MRDFLVQRLCLDAAGQPVPTLPIDTACTRTRLQTAGDPATYRKHDWPDATDPRHPLTGYQASDSVVQRRGTHEIIVQTFDFGDTRRVFGRFDAGAGDGGQALLVVDGWATAAMTEDGGDAVQWFIADACRATPAGDRRFLGWIFFRNDVDDTWRGAATRLNKARTPDACPARFNDAFTRYRRLSLDLPFRRISAAAVETASYRLDLIVSEHYGGADIANADHLERFYFARGLGLVRWERWANPAVSHPDAAAAARMAESGRCPPTGMRETPDQAWKLLDCRMWTTMVSPPLDWSVDRYDWKALGGFGPPAR